MPPCHPSQVAVKRGQGDLAGAAELLKGYLGGQGATDWLAWEEAADVYLQSQVGACWRRCHIPGAAVRTCCCCGSCCHAVSCRVAAPCWWWGDAWRPAAVGPACRPRASFPTASACRPGPPQTFQQAA